MIVTIGIVRDGDAWNFGAGSEQPNPTVNADGSMDDAVSYCHAVGGYVELRDGRWRTWVDPDRALRPR
jgi:hypothetical protein